MRSDTAASDGSSSGVGIMRTPQKSRLKTSRPDIVIVGAGPYGLSISAHLRALGVSFRIFGSPMNTWRDHMPKGMFLKSDGFASNISDPQCAFTLKEFCRQRGVPYDDTRIPVSLGTFAAYGDAFQRRFIPELEDKQVTAIARDSDAFRIQLDTGEQVESDRVLLAVGITHFHYLPPEFANLPPELLSHSFVHTDPERFRGEEVTIVGAGASAMDLAALLHEGGASVTVIARSSRIRFHDPPGPRPLWKRLRYPASGIGPGLQSRFFATSPLLFHSFPQSARVAIVRHHLGPAASWTVRERIVGRVPLLLGYRTQRVEERNGTVRLKLVDKRGREKEHTAAHVIAATGYRVDLRRLTFLSEEIQSQLAAVERSPALSTDFESTIPGLYFVGVSAANCFGPVLRFAFGAEFAARQFSRHIAKSLEQKSLARTAQGRETVATG
jgi:thioredoxin reductase